MVAACQFVYEEKYIAKYDVHPLKVGSLKCSIHSMDCQVVGSEGIFGFIALALLQIPLYFVKPSEDSFFSKIGDSPEGRLEDALDAFAMMSHSGLLVGLLSLIVFSIAFFNFAGVSITKHMSATTRKVRHSVVVVESLVAMWLHAVQVLDTLRTLVIWGMSMAFSTIDSEAWKMPRMKDQFLLQVPSPCSSFIFFFAFSAVWFCACGHWHLPVQRRPHHARHPEEEGGEERRCLTVLC